MIKNSYTYPYNDYIENYYSVDGGPISSLLTSFPLGDETYTHSDMSHINSIIRIESINPDFNGDVDLAIRVSDNDSSSDKIIFKLVVHPVNDPPTVELIGDVDLFMHNEAYPNDINIKVTTADVEESNETITLKDFDVVDGHSDSAGSYCYKVKKAVELISNTYAPGFINGVQVIPSDVPGFGSATAENPLTQISCGDMRFCTTVCYASLGMSKEKTEELCSFADYNEDQYICGSTVCEPLGNELVRNNNFMYEDVEENFDVPTDGWRTRNGSYATEGTATVYGGTWDSSTSTYSDVSGFNDNINSSISWHWINWSLFQRDVFDNNPNIDYEISFRARQAYGQTSGDEGRLQVGNGYWVFFQTHLTG